MVSKKKPALPLPFQIYYLFTETVFFPNLQLVEGVEVSVKSSFTHRFLLSLWYLQLDDAAGTL